MSVGDNFPADTIDAAHERSVRAVESDFMIKGYVARRRPNAKKKELRRARVKSTQVNYYRKDLYYVTRKERD